jgi:hypothetical protein
MAVALGGVGIGLSVMGKLGEAGSRNAQMQQSAIQADRAAKAGRIAADQTNATLRDELQSVFGNIMTQRAAANVDPNSPTTQAILAAEGEESDKQRVTKVRNIIAQADSDTQAAAFYRKAGKAALTWGTIGAGGYGISMATGVPGQNQRYG